MKEGNGLWPGKRKGSGWMKEQVIRRWTALLLMGMTLLFMITFVLLDKKEYGRPFSVPGFFYGGKNADGDAGGEKGNQRYLYC